MHREFEVFIWVHGDFLLTLFSKWANSSGVNSRGHFLSMRIRLLG